ncbi:flavin-containing monooxygenase [Rhodopirellula islandica]|uniref:Flavin-containing monooxygenase n=1 Tax=Rhodopirellula islandica TaxID=595434 RepID=A0A0J1B5J3_RHOIS|nr:SidA/IucD/PvdA family monooxygenase [Rhodopirellula islandica]KLU01873.1 flavin-containing monooxygenase [Rhodopirellula islandica]
MSEHASPVPVGSQVAVPKPKPRLAIVGCGSSGLVTLKNARDQLPDWEIVCFEKSDRITGCWGNPSPGFVSTSTKYTTQFACFPLFDDSVSGDGVSDFRDFFCDGEYGDYLESFATAFSLHSSIRCKTRVDQIRYVEASNEWQLKTRGLEPDDSPQRIEIFQAVIICTGLAARARTIPPSRAQSANQASLRSETPRLLNNAQQIDEIENQTVVVIGGGESAVDFADRLSRPERNNRVFLSLKSGIRVSPRYHPIHGVPSDFLRNRLMLSIHPDLRNWIGERFVKARIRYADAFRRWFPTHKASPSQQDEPQSDRERKKNDWAMRLTRAAKDDLFNMFHNKSDRFLDSVADDRICIVGPAADSLDTYFDFERERTRKLCPDVVVPAIGYESCLEALSDSEIQLSDFYLGCCHRRFRNLFLVGFARPIIGNVPTISEMQAKFAVKLLSGDCSLPIDFARQHDRDTSNQRMRFGKLNLAAIYPVEMIPYCDRLSRLMGDYPSLKRCGSLGAWFRVQLATSTTMHYELDDRSTRSRLSQAKVLMPPLFIVLLLMLKPVDWSYRLLTWRRRAPKKV